MSSKKVGMRVIIGEIDTDRVFYDSKVEVGKPIELEFPIPVSTLRVALVKDNKKQTLVLLFRGA